MASIKSLKPIQTSINSSTEGSLVNTFSEQQGINIAEMCRAGVQEPGQGLITGYTSKQWNGVKTVDMDNDPCNLIIVGIAGNVLERQLIDDFQATSCQEIKDRLVENLKWPSNCLKLSCEDRELDLDQSLSAAGVKPDGTLTLVMSCLEKVQVSYIPDHHDLIADMAEDMMKSNTLEETVKYETGTYVISSEVIVGSAPSINSVDLAELPANSKVEVDALLMSDEGRVGGRIAEPVRGWGISIAETGSARRWAVRE